ncbi:superoxide dismutase family protein [Sphingomonas oligophenolica]|uniref:Superoxide dismutase family protein n=1 Tax=Sphingomonas oligophenolica TaxID=301154 RepID=A0A502CTZ4_9SPHN|nr:superoxide dismutase family protein [Sphingomonas oligophenolica]TPG15286.1 superoxide dismutase family protein [Sphingomonas oligophenolica]
MRTTLTVTLGAAAMALGGCENNKIDVGMPIANAMTATAAIRTATGATVGRATAMDVAGGIRYTIDVTGLPPGTHGAHIHMTGRCDAPDFATAGGHWNPTGAKHGTMNPMGQHDGDLPNLIIGTGGRGTLGITVPGQTMAGLLDADGAAIVIHAGPDDLMTDPSGNSGGRIACGVFTPN